MINHGVKPGKLAGNWEAGTIPWVNRNPSADWRPYVVIGEHQSWGSFDCMACVSFASNNTCEIQIKHQTGMEVNHSDRFLAKVSGTTQEGNYVSAVLDALRAKGYVFETEWPVPPLPVTWDSYYATISQNLLNKGLGNLITFDLPYEYLTDMSPANVRHEMQHAPLLITIPGHEITALYLEPDNDTLWILDDYIFNVDPSQPFERTIKLSEVTDIFKAVLTVKDSMQLINDNGTIYIVGSKGKIGLADEGLYNALKLIDDEQTGSTAALTQVKVIESVNAFQIKNN